MVVVVVFLAAAFPGNELTTVLISKDAFFDSNTLKRRAVEEGDVWRYETSGDCRPTADCSVGGPSDLPAGTPRILLQDPVK